MLHVLKKRLAWPLSIGVQYPQRVTRFEEKITKNGMEMKKFGGKSNVMNNFCEVNEVQTVNISVAYPKFLIEGGGNGVVDHDRGGWTFVKEWAKLLTHSVHVESEARSTKPITCSGTRGLP